MDDALRRAERRTLQDPDAGGPVVAALLRSGQLTEAGAELLALCCYRPALAHLGLRCVCLPGYGVQAQSAEKECRICRRTLTHLLASLPSQLRPQPVAMVLDLAVSLSDFARAKWSRAAYVYCETCGGTGRAPRDVLAIVCPGCQGRGVWSDRAEVTLSRHGAMVLAQRDPGGCRMDLLPHLPTDERHPWHPLVSVVYDFCLFETSRRADVLAGSDVGSDALARAGHRLVQAVKRLSRFPTLYPEVDLLLCLRSSVARTLLAATSLASAVGPGFFATKPPPPE